MRPQTDGQLYYKPLGTSRIASSNPTRAHGTLNMENTPQEENRLGRNNRSPRPINTARDVRNLYGTPEPRCLLADTASGVAVEGREVEGAAARCAAARR